jgi:hypothetical protein
MQQQSLRTLLQLSLFFFYYKVAFFKRKVFLSQFCYHFGLMIFLISSHFTLMQSEANIKACVGYLAPDCKASTARIGAVSLPQSAWLLQSENGAACFAARCVGILQGHSSPAKAIF